MHVQVSGPANPQWKGGRCASLLRNIETTRARNRQWAKDNPAKATAKVQLRAARKIQATPAWADLVAIQRVYALASKLTEDTDIEHHVDHIVPLRGKNVCGLHVENNLQVLTKTENMKKANKHE